jgi:hypothetical protein
MAEVAPEAVVATVLSAVDGVQTLASPRSVHS